MLTVMLAANLPGTRTLLSPEADSARPSAAWYDYESAYRWSHGWPYPFLARRIDPLGHPQRDRWRLSSQVLERDYGAMIVDALVAAASALLAGAFVRLRGTMSLRAGLVLVGLVALGLAIGRQRVADWEVVDRLRSRGYAVAIEPGLPGYFGDAAIAMFGEAAGRPVYVGSVDARPRRHSVLGRLPWFDEDFAAVRSFSGLKRADLRGLEVTRPQAAQLASLHDLRVLSLENSNVGDDVLAEVSRSQSLEWLNLNGTQATDEGLAMLAAMPRLRALSLRHASPIPSALVELTARAQLTHVEANDKLTDADVTALAGCHPSGRIEFLLADLSPLSDCGAADLARMKHLRFLDLSGSGVTDAGLAAILKGCPDLEHLRLRGTSVTDASVASLIAAPRLQSVDAGPTLFSPPALTALKTAAPQLQIIVAAPPPVRGGGGGGGGFF
ncbi:MAG: hypothetical protein HYS13_23605 [Planctomycetia bacterium]|nr:hypothetical protein [Planctomycetia bacterium]